MFRVAPLFALKHLEAIFRHKVFTMLLSKGKITQDMVDMLMSWRHSGFNVFCGSRIQPGDEIAMENLARYIIRASFSQERQPTFPRSRRSFTGQRMEQRRRSSMLWNGSRLCVPMFPTKGNRWSDIMVITVTCLGASGKRRTAMRSSPRSWNRKAHRKNSDETGLG